jgi:hypothetical protein
VLSERAQDGAPQNKGGIMKKGLFSPEELEELRRADSEIDENYSQTAEEIAESRKRDRAAKLDSMNAKDRKIAENKRAYYEANREKYNAYMREYQRKRKAAANGA